MIYKHQYLTEQYLKGKQKHIINKQEPLLLILSKQFTFLNSLLVNSLQMRNISFKIQYHICSQIMSFQLPAIAFKNHFLSQQNLIQFICDLLLQNQSYQNFIQRKQIIKDQYKKWFTLLKQQNQSLVTYTKLKNIGIHNQQDYYNHVFSQYFTIASWIKSDILQRKYDNYKKDQINVQNLFVYDIINSILTLCEKTKLQYVLRSSFQNLMEWKEQFQNQIKNQIKNQILPQSRQRCTQIEIITQTMQDQNKIYNKIQTNHKRFAIIFTVMAGLYFKFVS